MNRCFIIWILCLACGSASAQNHCLIKVNIEECLNCLVLARQLKAISPGLKPQLVFPTWYESEAVVLLEKGLGFTWPENAILYSDSLYESLQTGSFSSIHVFDPAGKELYQCPLQSLESCLPVINSFAPLDPKEIRQIRLADSVVFSRQVQISPVNDRLYIHDYFFNIVRVISLGGDSLEYSIDGKTIDRKTLHQAIFGDWVRYEESLKYDSIMTRYGKNHCKIESIYVEEDTLFSMVTLPYPLVSSSKGKNTLSIELEFLILKWVDGKMTGVLPVGNLVGKTYDIDQTNAFFRWENAFYLSIFKDDLKGKNYFMARYDLGAKGLDFKDFCKIEVPDFYTENQFAYQYFVYRYQSPFVFFAYTPEFFSLATGNRYLLPVITGNTPGTKDIDSFHLLATFTDQREIRYLYKRDETYYLGLSSRNSEKSENTTVWPGFGENLRKGNPVFLNDNTLVFIQKTNEISFWQLRER